jgi:hypothetical protein
MGWLEWILHTDPGVLLTSVEILRKEYGAANLGGAADDHRIPERDPGPLMDAYRGKDVVSRRCVQIPACIVSNDLFRRFRVERLCDLPGDVHEELLQHHCRALAAWCGGGLESGAGEAVFLPGFSLVTGAGALAPWAVAD